MCVVLRHWLEQMNHWHLCFRIAQFSWVLWGFSVLKHIVLCTTKTQTWLISAIIGSTWTCCSHLSSKWQIRQFPVPILSVLSFLGVGRPLVTPICFKFFIWCLFIVLCIFGSFCACVLSYIPMMPAVPTSDLEAWSLEGSRGALQALEGTSRRLLGGLNRLEGALKRVWSLEAFKPFCKVLGGYFNTSAKLHTFFQAKSGSIRTSTFPQSKSAHPTQTWPAPFERNPCYNANNGTRDTPGHDYLSSSNAILLHLLL